MWESPDAQQKLLQIQDLLDQVLNHTRLVMARGTQADRVLAVGVGIETLLGINELYAIDDGFRSRTRVLAERWSTISSDADRADVNRMLTGVLMALERLVLLVRSPT
jgi:hypothetical protein